MTLQEIWTALYYRRLGLHRKIGAISMATFLTIGRLCSYTLTTIRALGLALPLDPDRSPDEVIGGKRLCHLLRRMSPQLAQSCRLGGCS
jgi:hypothetical protein